MADEIAVDDITEIDTYQYEAFKTAMFPPEIGPLYCAMGALGESGELADVLLDYFLTEMGPGEVSADWIAIVKAIGAATVACKEVERLKKLARKGKLDLPQLPPLNDAVRGRVRSEQGDCLWYQAGTAEVSGLKLSDVAQQNIRKLRERRDAGVIASAGETVEERRANAD